MPKIKYDVSSSDPDRAIQDRAASPQPGRYVALVDQINDTFRRGDNGKPDKDYPQLEVVFEIRKAEKKRNDVFKGAYQWLYLPYGDNPNAEKMAWRMDQFLQAVGAPVRRRRSGTIDTDDYVGKPVVLTVRAGTNQDGVYRGEIATVLAFDKEEWMAGSSDEEDGAEDDLDDEDAETDSAEEEDGEDVEEVDDYNDLSLADLRSECEARELDAKGTKSQLVARLEADDESADAEGTDDSAEPDYESMPIAELRAMARERGLVARGTKEAVIGRLEKDDAAGSAEEPPADEEEEEPPARQKRAAAKPAAAAKKAKKPDDFPF